MCVCTGTREHTYMNKVSVKAHYSLHKIQQWHPCITTNLLSTLVLMTILLQLSSVAQSYPTLCDPKIHSLSGLPVHHQLPEFTQTHAHQGGDAIQPSHPLSYPSSPAPNPSQHQGLFQRVNPSHEVAKVLGFQLQHQSF